MVVLITFHTEMRVLNGTIIFGDLRWYLGAVLTKRGLRFLFLVSVYDIVNDVDGQDLVVFEDDVLMFEDLGVLFFVVEVDGFEALGAVYGVV